MTRLDPRTDRLNRPNPEFQPCIHDKLEKLGWIFVGNNLRNDDNEFNTYNRRILPDDDGVLPINTYIDIVVTTIESSAGMHTWGDVGIFDLEFHCYDETGELVEALTYSAQIKRIIEILSSIESFFLKNGLFFVENFSYFTEGSSIEQRNEASRKRMPKTIQKMLTAD